jgi:integrase
MATEPRRARSVNHPALFRRANMSIEMAAWCPRTRGRIDTGNDPKCRLTRSNSRERDAVMKDELRGPDGERLDRHAAGRIVRRVARRAGINKVVGPHTFRHAFITAALDAGVPLRDVQEAASHADPRTTMRYDRTGTPRSVAKPANGGALATAANRRFGASPPSLIDMSR